MPAPAARPGRSLVGRLLVLADVVWRGRLLAGEQERRDVRLRERLLRRGRERRVLAGRRWAAGRGLLTLLGEARLGALRLAAGVRELLAGAPEELAMLLRLVRRVGEVLVQLVDLCLQPLD